MFNILKTIAAELKRANDLKEKEINIGLNEIKLKYNNQIKFTDTLKCISFRK